jgi:hypothetical protein
MDLMITNVTIIALVVIASILGGSQSMVFAQSSSNYITSQIEEAEQKINDSLEESQQSIGHIDGGLQKIDEVDIKWIRFFTDLFALD